ncbi:MULTISPECIES: TetR/AcrR family transcriptional regulator [Brucella/Ochrobactrum group]|uniref:TetR/AcrR family transcriptional regulator n=1 Tax=Brucella/Ochrobactrum group TaxID=2826938 RepID=UPI001C05CFED|nr:TetR/AcrR family transcriptional regulator [Brucella sp. NBRC 12950]QWK80687.1 TetR/AcrR family transcriptional regulator [Ochrobactrum sp. BTU1]GLU28070.1 TetR family transcriptional regulator [Brucella sp. NBRC 12950]
MSNILSNYDHILVSARELIVRGGYNGFSYADIAEIVGIRKASIHHHFPTKLDLVLTLVNQYRLNAETGIAQLEQNVTDPVDQLRAFVDHWAQCIEDGSRPFCVCALLASELPLLPREIAIEVNAYFQLLSKWLARVFESASKLGRIHISRAPEVEAEVFMAMVHGAMLSARAFADPGKFSLITNAALDSLAPRH